MCWSCAQQQLWNHHNSASTAYDVGGDAAQRNRPGAQQQCCAGESFDASGFEARQLINGVACPDHAADCCDGGQPRAAAATSTAAAASSMGVLGATRRVAIDGSLRPNALLRDRRNLAPGSSASTPSPPCRPTHRMGALCRACRRYDALQQPGRRLRRHADLHVHCSRRSRRRRHPRPGATGLGLRPAGADRLLTATIDDSTAGGSAITAAEFVIDDTAGTPTAHGRDRRHLRQRHRGSGRYDQRHSAGVSPGQPAHSLRNAARTAPATGASTT